MTPLGAFALVLTIAAGNPFWPIAARSGAGWLVLGFAVAFVPVAIAWVRPLRDRARYSILLLTALSLAYGGWVFVLAFALIAPRAPGSDVAWPAGVPEPDEEGFERSGSGPSNGAQRSER